MLCKIWGVNGGDYEEFSFFWYVTPCGYIEINDSSEEGIASIVSVTRIGELEKR
jgi:hypothetical protein